MNSGMKKDKHYFLEKRAGESGCFLNTARSLSLHFLAADDLNLA
ncbi:hypothetical protein KR50_31710 [Jeotgalibacillus campisalis]|uniref:Uncharacterized protein n=1 Tax=Jeotgalibacillus campisalis TaxID=220754 RepID=A0A0C2VGL2_9BACL|nr:hypothetical protein KR50_31710 [Jeotgalibacillus campisalis]